MKNFKTAAAAVFYYLDVSNFLHKRIVGVDRYGEYQPAYRAAGEHHETHEENRPIIQ